MGISHGICDRNRDSAEAQFQTSPIIPQTEKKSKGFLKKIRTFFRFFYDIFGNSSVSETSSAEVERSFV